MNMKKILLYILQLIPAAVFLFASYGKFTGAEASVKVFTALSMEPTGRIIIATLEFITALFLLIPRTSALGAFLGFAIMIGALIAHVTILGMTDLAALVMLFVLILTGIIVYIKRKELPIFGEKSLN